ncbi:hypothetical protein NC652_039394 [Populus alba x Populus x berolinensis]|nr:hypothetical protein NC652_039394 [Populus alba x Populus x berolinensis]
MMYIAGVGNKKEKRSNRFASPCTVLHHRCIQ